MGLDEIRERVRNQPALRGAFEETPASIYEEEDGLETLLSAPEYYSKEAQNNIVKMFLDMADDRRRLLQALDAAQALLEQTAAQFTATSRRMHQQVLDRVPDREDAETIIRYASYTSAWEAAAHQFRRAVKEALAIECDGGADCKAIKHNYSCYGGDHS